MLAKGILGKGGLFVVAPLDYCPALTRRNTHSWVNMNDSILKCVTLPFCWYTESFSTIAVNLYFAANDSCQIKYEWL